MPPSNACSASLRDRHDSTRCVALAFAAIPEYRHADPHDLLEADTLNNLLEDFVTREGTDNGDETPLDVRERARHALRRGEAVILFDPESQQCQLMLRSEVPAELLRD